MGFPLHKLVSLSVFPLQLVEKPMPSLRSRTLEMSTYLGSLRGRRDMETGGDWNVPAAPGNGLTIWQTDDHQTGSGSRFFDRKVPNPDSLLLLYKPHCRKSIAMCAWDDEHMTLADSLFIRSCIVRRVSVSHEYQLSTLSSGLIPIVLSVFRT